MNSPLTVNSDRPSGATKTAMVGTLRILATTDLHAHLFPFNYVHDKPSPGTGLTGIATLITQAREEAAQIGAGTILLDNGDFLQGTPLAEHLANEPITKKHPIVASVKQLGYDVIGLGNHDFDFGLDYLRQFAAAVSTPLVCSNLAGVDLGGIQQRAPIPCVLPGAGNVTLSIGILSLLPPLTDIWHADTFGPNVQLLPLRETVQKHSDKLRKSGADIVVVLAHMGPGHGAKTDGALALTDITGVDAVITGHTHRRLPGNDYAGRNRVDAATGKLHKLPAVMPGFAGSDLGVLDLFLTRNEEGHWQVQTHDSNLRPNTSSTRPDPKITELCMPAHQTTRAALSRKVGQIDCEFHSYFSMLRPCAISRMIAEAKARLVIDQIAGTDYAKLPILASVATRATAGREGPDAFLHFRPGPILQRHIYGLAPYANHIIAARITGSDLWQWLEHSSRHYDGQNGRLINPALPSFHHDTIYGLTTEIDLSKPVGHRVKYIRHAGKNVHPNSTFIIATHGFRAAGGGGYPPPESGQYCRLPKP